MHRVATLTQSTLKFQHLNMAEYMMENVEDDHHLEDFLDFFPKVIPVEWQLWLPSYETEEGKTKKRKKADDDRKNHKMIRDIKRLKKAGKKPTKEEIIRLINMM